MREHAGAILVAVGYAALALAEGGFGERVLASAAIAIWWLVIVGLFIRVWPGSRAPQVAIVAGACLAALGALSGTSLLWADDAGRAFADTLLPVAYLGLFAFVVLVSPRSSARSWLGGLAAAIAAVAAIALLSRVEPGLFGGADRELAEQLPLAADRLSYPLGYWNALAAVMAIGAVLLVWLGAHARTVLGRALATAALALPVLAVYLTQSRGGVAASVVGLAVLVVAGRRRARLLAVAALGGAGGALLVALAAGREAFRTPFGGEAAESQGLEMGAAIVATLAVVALVSHLADRRLSALALPRIDVSPRVAGRLAIAAAVLVVVVAPASGAVDEFSDPGGFSGAEEERITVQGSGRYQFWSVALDAFADQPLGGIGAGNYELAWNADPPIPWVVEHAHSLYLKMLAELGVLGPALMLAFLALGAAAGAARLRRSSGSEVPAALAVLAAGALSASLEWTWEIPAAFGPVVVAVALLTGLATLRPEWPRGLPERESRSLPEWLGSATSQRERFGLGVALMLAGFACLWISGVVLLTEIQLAESRAAVDRGDLDEAATNARYATTIQPWAAEPRLQLAQVEELRGRIDAARDALEEAIERSPEDYQTWIVAARVASAAGMDAEARRASQRAAELSPVPLVPPS